MESNQVRLNFVKKFIKIVQMNGFGLQWEAVREMKESGLSSADAYNILNEMLSEFPEYYDSICDILDVVTWWCSPHLRIWDSKYDPSK